MILLNVGVVIMKRLLVFILLLLFPFNALAEERVNVTFSKCVDGDTIKVIMDDKEETVRFLAIDTPETKHPTKGEEPYGKEASNYTCNRVKEAQKLELEFDANSDKKDKYDRYLAWIFVDDNLLQAELIKNGLAEVAYLYGDYKYTDLLKDYEQTAINSKVGKYSSVDNSSYTKNNTEKQDEKKKDSTKEKIKNKILKYLSELIDEILDEIFK